jgi:hypothetical protein
MKAAKADMYTMRKTSVKTWRQRMCGVLVVDRGVCVCVKVG